MSTSPDVYDEPTIQAKLALSLPLWRYENGCLIRTYKTSGWRASMFVANGIAYVAEAAWHHPDLLVTYPAVTVKLSTHDAGGITNKDFELAQKIEEWVLWQPQITHPESALEGTPNNHAYLQR